jgi:NADPH-dependent 2,4-dienoyl-CoA reductase/sulfur reductase-like enzyme
MPQNAPLRVTLNGIARKEPGFGFRFAGRDVTGFAGESLAAALVAEGELALRQTAQGDRRGIFCGMGVCGDCSVLVNGQLRRACMTAAAPGLDVQPLPARRGVVAADPAPTAGETLEADLLIIGAGPAGLAAARAAGGAGLRVIIVDERKSPGGQYFKQPGSGFAVTETALDAQFAAGRRLIGAVAATPARLCSEASVWSARTEDDVIVADMSGPDGPMQVRARRLVIATGAMERPWVVPGWTLPGVMTVGAAQTLLRSGSVAPGRRVVVAGNGPLGLQLAAELLMAGIDVVAVADRAPRPGLAQAGAALAMLSADPRLVAAGIGHLARLARAGVPMLWGHEVTTIAGNDHASVVTFAPTGGGRPRQFAIDALAIGNGFQPQAELARALGCALGWHDGTARVVRDDDGRTSVTTVFVAGDGGGLGGAQAALAQGWLAGAAAARDLLGHLPAALAAEFDTQRAALARARRFQGGLWRLFAAPVAAPPAGETLLCRCEAVSAAAVDALLAQGLCDPGSIKRATRLGMGRCQGRYCAPLLAARLADGRVPAETDLFAPRPPFKPASIASIAAGPPQ